MVDVEQTCCDEANGMLSGLTNKQSSLSTIEEIYVYSQIEFEFEIKWMDTKLWQGPSCVFRIAGRSLWGRLEMQNKDQYFLCMIYYVPFWITLITSFSITIFDAAHTVACVVAVVVVVVVLNDSIWERRLDWETWDSVRVSVELEAQGAVFEENFTFFMLGTTSSAFLRYMIVLMKANKVNVYKLYLFSRWALLSFLFH